MLHLWPWRYLFYAVLTLTATIVIIINIAVGENSKPIDILLVLLKWISVFSASLTALLVVSWRWSKKIQQMVFPYLGGEWQGEIIFNGTAGEETRNVTLHVKHTPFSLKLNLESVESVSRTLAVQASKSPDLQDDDKLYYVYLNTRKEGGVKTHRSYRGVAILRIKSRPLSMVGDYFTDSDRSGRLHFDVVKLNPWWALWK